MVGKSLRLVMNFVLLACRIVNDGSKSQSSLKMGINRSLVDCVDNPGLVLSGRKVMLKFVW